MIILCADDFGLTAGVSRAIAHLCHERRLSAASALVTFDDWPDQAQSLQELRATTAIGLHLNLTLGRPQLPAENATYLDGSGAFLSLTKLIARALTRRLDINQIQLECSAQITAFRNATGYLPDFVDGHQHVHALPVVRQGVLAAIAEQHWLQRPLLRSPLRQPDMGSLGLTTTLKARTADWLARGYDHDLSRAGLPYNDTFAGFSAFSAGHYADELEAALQSGKSSEKGTSVQRRCHLVMCHPGYVDDALARSGDPVVEQRQEEFDALMSSDQLPERIWQPVRGQDGAINWFEAIGR